MSETTKRASSRPTGLQSTGPIPKRSLARPPQATQDPDFLRRSTQAAKLWNPEDDAAPSASRPKQPAKSLWLIKQPETRPISQEQLVKIKTDDDKKYFEMPSMMEVRK
ncbi:hypothetical protein F5Y17DRAFT_453572 [Xylariaceae sp. FL0594]|nr:hypothetical protein F5Y17DRAFT_453572 [Xylariaceae sp. FL0594]